MSFTKRVAMSDSPFRPARLTIADPGWAPSIGRPASRALSPELLESLIDHLDRQPVPRDVVVDFEAHSGHLVFGALPLRAFPAQWVSWPVSAAAEGTGVALALDDGRSLVVAVDRSGVSEWFVVRGRQIDRQPSSAGRLLDDACRLRLGGSTPPPDRSPDWYWLGQWLGGVVDAAARCSDQNTLLDVISVASAHPAIEGDELEGLDLAGLCGFVVERHREHVQIADWECIRLDALDDRLHRFHELALSLDLGAFSRWVSASCAPLGDLATELTACCSPLGLRLLGSVIADTIVGERLPE